MRTHFVWMLGLAAAFSSASAQSSSAGRPLPDVYLITIDTLRADHVHCYGDDRIQTPALDALAAEGIRFTQAFTPSPITNTSHTSILTGLLPSAHGVTDFGIPLATTYPTWAELLKNDSYRTAAFIGAVILDSHTLAPGLDRGFDFYDNFPVDAPITQHWGRVERRGADVVHRAEKWMDANPQRPRFAWVHLYDPHDPYEPPPPYSRIYKDRLYDGEIAYADSALGNFVTYLKQHGRYENSLIIVVGDHGEGLGEHGEETHGIFLYDSTTHVPLIMKLPVTAASNGGAASPAPKVVEAQVQTTDILPTVLDLLGISAPSQFAGRSLTLYLGANQSAGRTVFGETDYPLRFGWAPLRAVRAGGFKFIEAPRPELYDLKSDPAELKNQYEPWNPTVQQLRKDIASSAMRPPRSSPSTGAAGKDKLNELRALGYLGPRDEQTSTNTPELSSLPDPKDKIEEQNLLHSAMMLVDQGRPSDARPLFEKVLQRDAESPAALRQLGELELAAGNYRKAADYFAIASKASPDDAEAALHQAEALDKLGDRKGAQAALEAAVKQSPGQIDARLLLARIDLKLGERAAAEDQFEAALLLKPANEEALLGLATEYLADNRFAEVVELLEPAAKSPSASAQAYRLLAKSYLGLGKKAEAAQALRQARVAEAAR